MSHLTLQCTRCDTSHPADMVTLECSSCRAPLNVQYTGSPSYPGPQPSSWTVPAERLPLHRGESTISLGEGNTPCVSLPAVARSLGLRRLHAKLEFMNPTGSFKDRGSSIMISVAREHGVTELVEDSSGNAGASVAAYAARAGMKAHIFAPAGAPPAKLAQIQVYGADTHAIEGPRQAATQAALRYSAERGTVYASHNLSPYYTEGTKSFAYEVAKQFDDGPPRHVVFPVGNGSLFIGAWKGFRELLEDGTIHEMPRLHCVQARAVMPIVAAYRSEEWKRDPEATTIAGGISVDAPPRKQQVLDVLQETKGVALAVGEIEIARWHRTLAETEGIYAEPTSAAAFAGLEELVKTGEVQATDTVLVPITGSGLKDASPRPLQ